MGCGLISQRGPSVEVRHPISLDPGRRAAGARVVEHGGDHQDRNGQASSSAIASIHGSQAAATGSENIHGGEGSHEQRGADGRTRSGRGSGHSAGGFVADEGRHSGVHGRALPGRRFTMGERVVLASRLPSYAQDHAFCFECGSFFQSPGANRLPQCSRCGSSFVQFLRPPGNENWIVVDSMTGSHYSFDDQLDNSISASLEETPATKRPTQAAFLRTLPTLHLTELDVQARKQLDARDPKCHCAICRESFCENFAVKRLPCGHEFHDGCIVPWLQSNCSCPICRFRLPEATEGEEGDDDSEEVPRLKRPSSAAASVSVVGVPASMATNGTLVGATAEGVPTTAQGSGGTDGLVITDASVHQQWPIGSPVVNASAEA